MLSGAPDRRGLPLEEGDPLLKLRCSIVTHRNTGVYIIVQQIKQSTIACIHNTDGGHKKYKTKRKKVHGACEELIS